LFYPYLYNTGNLAYKKISRVLLFFGEVFWRVSKKPTPGAAVIIFVKHNRMISDSIFFIGKIFELL
jgi:hypothetical protein